MDRTENTRFIKVLRGASSLLVSQREVRNSYQTNRSIKTWATFFLLKSISVPGIIKTWVSQKKDLLSFCQMSEGCFRARLREMKQLGLLSISENLSIHLSSFKQAAHILGIDYKGIVNIEYKKKLHGKPAFQYHIILDEIRCNQQKQVEAINYKANKNLQLRETLLLVMIQSGADSKRLNDQRYFQECLLGLQQHFFKTGSDIWSVISLLRADVNRSVYGIKKHYGFKSTQSVSYLKKRLVNLDVATIKKTRVESKDRTRLYIPDEHGKKREGVKYCRRTKCTVLFLCDAIMPKIEMFEPMLDQKATTHVQ